MKTIHIVLFLLAGLAISSLVLHAQSAQPPEAAQSKAAEQKAPSEKDKEAEAYSGMYAFLKEGEFVQLTVEDGGRVTGFISRYGDGESDKGAFLDQFFKSGKLDGNRLSFTTDIVHGVSFDFKGSVERGEGKTSGDDGYYVLKGSLTENVTDVNKKVTSHLRDVVLKMFPQEAAPAPVVRK